MSDRSLDILQVSTYDIGGGADRIAWNLHQQLRERNHTATLAVGQKRTVDSDVYHIDNDAAKPALTRMLLRGAKQLSDPRHGLKGTWRLSRMLFNLAEPTRQQKIAEGCEDFCFPASHQLLDIAKNKDLIHAHNLHGGYFDLNILPQLSQQTPTILTLHDAWMLAGHCAHSLDCNKWESGCVGCPHLLLPPAINKDNAAHNWQVKKSLYAHCKLNIITPCQWLMDKVVRSILAPAIEHAMVIPNGVDLSIYQPQDKLFVREQLNLPDQAKVLLFSASGIRNAVWKDYQTMRRAVSIVANEFHDQRVIFLALGDDGPTEHIGNAEIRFVPFTTDQHKIATYYQAADVYIHAARADTFPNVIIEALACGCPVVATDTGGISEQIFPGRNGYLTPVGDAHSMAVYIIDLLNNRKMHQAISRHAANHAAKQFSLDQQVDKYLAFYETVLSSQPIRKAA